MSNKMTMAVFGRAPQGKADTESTENDNLPIDDAADDQPMVGNYARIKVDLINTKLDKAQKDLEEAQGLAVEAKEIKRAQIEGILNGTIPIQIDPYFISDEVSSDRVTSSDDDDASPFIENDDEDAPASFSALKENIQSRGQRTPIRVRPADPSWRPSYDSPWDTGTTKFTVQSGRRRLRACRELQKPVFAFLSFPDEGSSRIDDLQERYFENVARRELTIAEKLYSIGMISDSLDMTQIQIGELLHVDQSVVSRAKAVYANFDKLKDMIDLSTATARDIERALYRLKNPDQAAPTPPSQDSIPFRNQTIGEYALRMRVDSKGKRHLTITSENLDERLVKKLVETLGAPQEHEQVDN